MPVAEISAEQVGRLLRVAEMAQEAATTARVARDTLDEVLLCTAREAKVGLRELAAITGLHPNTIRAGIQRAAGEASIAFDQPELDIPGLASTAADLTSRAAKLREIAFKDDTTQPPTMNFTAQARSLEMRP